MALASGLLLSLAAFALIAQGASAQQTVLRVGGAVPQLLTLSEADFGSMRHQSLAVDDGDQNGVYGGGALTDLLVRAGLRSGDGLESSDLAKFVIVSGAGGDRVTFSLAELDAGFTDRIVLVADTKDGKVLAADAAPYQLVVPGDKRRGRWVRRVMAIDVFDPGRQ